MARTFPLIEAAAALRCAASGGIAGKVVLVPASPSGADCAARPEHESVVNR